MIRAMNTVKETLIECPNCGSEFGVSEALSTRLQTEVEARLAADYDRRLKNAVSKAEARVLEAAALEMKDLREQLAEQEKKTQEAERQELALRKKARELAERQQKLDLELQRRLDEERKTIETRLREQMENAQALKLKEKELQIEELRKSLEEATRKSQQGSMERQGETLELDIEAALREQFPFDEITPVARGTRGADLVQEVRNGAGSPCGAILWETKNTKHFQNGWVDKLKQDQRTTGAALAVIVSAAMPDGTRDFGRIDGVWVASLRSWPALAVALREQLIHVAFARAASEGKREKMEVLYAYLSGDEFRHRVEAIVEAFNAMQEQLQKERRAMERIWNEREKQIERIIANTAGMYGDVRGLIGAGMPEIGLLALEAGVEEEGVEQ